MKIQRKTTRAAVPSMAMGDIAFNLLIFFVILAKASDDSHVKWIPARSDEVQNVGYSKVSIVIDVKNRVHLNGGHVSIAELGSAVERLLGDLPAGERTVLLKVHKDVTAVEFEPVIEAISEAGGDIAHILEKRRD